MRVILSILMLVPFIVSYSQEMKLTVSARNQSIKISLDDDNNNKVLIIKSAAQNSKQDYLTVKISNEETEQDWNRTFTLYNSDDSEIAVLKPMAKDEYEYCTNLIKLPKLQKDKDYLLYTVALPKDPKKAMLVRPARRLVCKVRVEN